MTHKPKRIGIYSGTFDPVHAGHLSFALQAMAAAKLDAVYFVPERRPRYKVGTEHFGHRVAMLQHAMKPHKHFGVIELEDVSFTVERTLPRLRKRFPNDQLVFLIGSDVTQHMAQWPGIEHLARTVELVVGVRSSEQTDAVPAALEQLFKAQAITVVQSFAATVSSRSVRDALRRRSYTPGLLRSVERYSNHNWLYISLA